MKRGWSLTDFVCHVVALSMQILAQSILLVTKRKRSVIAQSIFLALCISYMTNFLQITNSDLYDPSDRIILLIYDI